MWQKRVSKASVLPEYTQAEIAAKARMQEMLEENSELLSNFRIFLNSQNNGLRTCDPDLYKKIDISLPKLSSFASGETDIDDDSTRALGLLNIFFKMLVWFGGLFEEENTNAINRHYDSGREFFNLPEHIEDSTSFIAGDFTAYIWGGNVISVDGNVFTMDLLTFSDQLQRMMDDPDFASYLQKSDARNTAILLGEKISIEPTADVAGQSRF